MGEASTMPAKPLEVSADISGGFDVSPSTEERDLIVDGSSGVTLTCRVDDGSIGASIAAGASYEAAVTADIGPGTLKMGASVSDDVHWIYNDYNDLNNKPSIESVVLSGNRGLSDFGMSTVSNAKILDLFR